MASSQARIWLAASLAALGAYAALRHRHSRAARSRIHSIARSPLQPALLAAEPLAYAPDGLPGARTVDTPFGACRAYEFGDERGPKVLLVHGISTPCVSLRAVALDLARRGCRVLLYDLFGRGFSDNPTYHDHSEHLYISQILCVLSSSPIAWTGSNSFAVIGYSLGGGIAVSFARYFPALVSSLVLIGPSGLVREHHIAWQSYVLYYTEGIIPMCLTKYLVRRRLDTSHLNSAIDIEPLEASDAEAKDHHLETDTTQACERAVQFQLKHHQGFIDAFISAIRHAPITQQHEAWKIIGQRLAHQRAHPKSEDASRNGLCGAKVVLVLGESDSIIVRAEMEADARDTLGSAGVETLALEGGHDLPIAKPSATTDAIWASWVRSGLVNDAHGSDFTVPI